jgi:glycosyltransferase involved in cell wall biosynthesis
LVVSDGSTDDTDDWVLEAARHDPRIRLIRAVRHGHPSGPRNLGLAQARGEVIAYLDHDDQWHGRHLKVLLSAFDDGAELVATGFEYRDQRGTVTSTSEPLGLCWHPEIQALSPIFEPSRVAHRRGMAERVGGWRAGIGFEDWDLWLRMADAGMRFTTLQDRTAVLFSTPGGRRYRTPRRHRLPIAMFDDPRTARAVFEELRHKRHDASFRTAHSTDTKTWYRRLATTAAFAAPRGWDGDVEAEITKMTEDTGPLWPDLVLIANRGSYLLAQTLSCSTADHARRIEALARRIEPSQFALVDKIVAEYRGSPIAAALALESTAPPSCRGPALARDTAR